MLRSDQILSTVEMIQKENLDVRTVTMGINLLDCRTGDVAGTCDRIEERIRTVAGNFVPTCNDVSRKLGIPVVNKRISVTPIAFVGAGFDRFGFIELARCLDRAAAAVGVDILGGFSAQVEKGMTATDREYIASLPEALARTEKVCASINIATSQKGSQHGRPGDDRPDHQGTGRTDPGPGRVRRRQVCRLLQSARRQSLHGRGHPRPGRGRCRPQHRRQRPGGSSPGPSSG